MAVEAFKILGTLGLKGVQETKKDIADVTGQAEKSSSKIGSVFSKIGTGVGKAAKVIGTGIGVAAGALGGLTVKSLNMAGELEQNMGGSEAVFGKYAGKMQDTAKKAFSNMGLSTSDYLATANKMGALFQGAGFDVEKSMSMSQDAMQRAADVASIMGIDTSAAMEAVAGAAKGNFTMMDNLGVAMNETTLANYALEKGMKKSYDQMTQQEKIGVAMEMFMDKTAYAAGNYAKENETLAGSLGTAKAALSNFLSGAGSVDDVVSSFTNAAEVIVQNVTEIAPKLMTGITEIVQKIIPQIAPLLQQLLPPLIEGAVGLINGIVAAMPQIISAIMDAVPALIDGIVKVMNTLIEALPKLMEMIVSALPKLIPALIKGIVSMVVTICNNFAKIIQPIIKALPDIIVSIIEAIIDNLPLIIKGLIQAVVGIAKAVPQILSSLLKAFVEGFTKIWGKIKEVFNPLGKWFGGKFKEGKNNATKAWDGISNFFSNAKNKIVNAFSNIKEKLSKPFESARDAIKKVVDKIKGFFKNMKLNLPKIKLPHFKIDGKLSLNPPSVPKLKIDWYKKGGILTEPTIFDYNPMSNTAKVGGEAGAEAIAPIETLTGYVQEAVRAETTGLSHHIERLYDIIAYYLPLLLEGTGKQIVLDDGTLVGKLAPKLDRKLGAIYDRRARY